MSNEIGWESLLNSEIPTGCQLKAALFTTYDHPDERILAENILPILLKLNRESCSDGVEQKLFLLELDKRLKQLHDKIVVISSTCREESTDDENGFRERDSTYDWIWRSIRHMAVGRDRKAVQHSKLWMLHWGAANGSTEYLELVISSTNLTRSAFKNQIQAVWKTCISLQPKPSNKSIESWGLLPKFLQELDKSTNKEDRLAPFINLLKRADCPNGITFVASVPDTFTQKELQQTSWGAEGLLKAMPSGKGAIITSVHSPFVGLWDSKSLDRWCSSFAGTLKNLRLIWIENSHPWATKWIFPKGTLKTLKEARVSVLNLRNSPNDAKATDLFHDDHRSRDSRWSHAKIYAFRRGNSKRLLLTSANFSPAAWGREGSNGDVTIENFELGVCVEQIDWPLFDKLKTFTDWNLLKTVDSLPNRSNTHIMWARASWDGETVSLECRCDNSKKLKGELNCAGTLSIVNDWKPSSDIKIRLAAIPWADTKLLPSYVTLKYDDEALCIPVFDERSFQDRADSLPSEVDEDSVQLLRDQLLLEQYGGRVEIDDGDEVPVEDKDLDEPEDDDRKRKKTGSICPESYAVPTIVLARQYLEIVDNWGNRIKQTMSNGTAEFERQLLKQDGEQLIEAFGRLVSRNEQLGIGAKVAAEELALRLSFFKEAKCL